MSADRFIPFRKQDIIAMCLNEVAQEYDKTDFRQFCQLLSSLIHFEYYSVLESLKNDYAPFDPNAGTKQLTAFSAEQKNECKTAFAKNFASVLNAANFEKITEQDLQEALTEESLFKVRLEVEFDDFEQVVFYRRGASQISETLTSLFGLRKQTISFTNYDRVAVFITFKDKEHFDNKSKLPLGFEPGATIVKLFQNVPKADLEMLFPNSEVRMRPIDKAIIGASAIVGGAAVLITKLGASLVLVAALFAFWLGWRAESVEMTEQHMLSFAIGLGVFGSFVFKEWSKFKNRKIKFMKALSDNLYFKNLDNNAGVFHTLIDAAEEEDFKEAILAYTFLLNQKGGLTAQQLDQQIEQYFQQKYQCNLDFEIADALQKLARMKLITQDHNTYLPLPLNEAKAILDKHWDNIFDYN